MSAEPAAPLAVSTPDGLVQSWLDAGEGWQASQDAGEGRWPCWSPAGRLLAWSAADLVAGVVRSRVLVSNLWPGSKGAEVYAVPDGVPPAIAPGVPHYVHWSPRGDRLGIVARTRESLGLSVAAVDGSAPMLLAEGAPLFFSWSPSGERLAVHTGQQELFLIDPGSGARERLTDEAMGFRTPAWSSDGALLAFALPAEIGVRVVTTASDGWGQEEVARFPGGVALSFVGPTRTLSVAVTSQPGSTMFDALWLVPPGGPPVRLAGGPFASCHWSPDGRVAALLTPAQSPDRLFFVRAVDATGRVLAETDRFVPSDDLQAHTAFSDQYGLSHPLWSPDSTRLALAGRGRGDAVSPAFGDSLGEQVWCWRVERSGPLVPVTRGTFATFPAVTREPGVNPG